MAYALRYYKEFTHTDGTVIRLEIHKKDSTEEAIEIGDVVQGLSLQIQGQQDDIDTPIQKTSVLMTFVDAPDIEDGRKNGFWEEFYTADATQWQVIIKERGAMSSSYDTIWGGYITPDSFSEDLVYRGSVSITARDNIGHMQDFPFDAEGDNKGMIKLWDLVRLGWAKIESPMSLDWHGDGNGVNWLYTEYGNILYDTLMNVSFFEDMNWYEAIEKALYSYGLVMRYVGRNRVHICPLRDLPKHGYHDYEYFATLEPTFVSGARRELAPAVKEIRESVSYDLVDEISQPQVKEDDFRGVQTSYKCKIEGDTWGTLEHDAPIWAINPTDNWGQEDANKSLFFDTSRYEVGNFTKRAGNEDELRKYMYIAANNVDARSVRFFCLVNPTDLVIRIKFGLPISLTLAGVLEQQSAFCLHRIMYSISINQGGTIYHYSGNGDWTNTENEVLKEYDPQQNVTEFEVEVFPNDDIIQGIESTYASLFLTIHKIEYRQIGYGSLQKTGLYACIQDLTIEVPGTKSLREKNDVNTIYNEGNNVILDHDPELAPAFDLVPLGRFIKNGILDAGNYAPFPPGGFRYPNGESFQLAVHIHKQLLCYHAKPNSVISGTIINSGMLGLACNWLWRGKEHLLMSGNLNLLNGHMENAVIREFTRYEDMWND